VEALTPRRNPCVDALLEHIERQGAGAEDLVVEFADIEATAERLSGTRPSSSSATVVNFHLPRPQKLPHAASSTAVFTKRTGGPSSRVVA